MLCAKSDSEFSSDFTIAPQRVRCLKGQIAQGDVLSARRSTFPAIRTPRFHIGRLPVRDEIAPDQCSERIPCGTKLLAMGARVGRTVSWIQAVRPGRSRDSAVTTSGWAADGIEK